MEYPTYIIKVNVHNPIKQLSMGKANSSIVNILFIYWIFKHNKVISPPKLQQKRECQDYYCLQILTYLIHKG